MKKKHYVYIVMLTVVGMWIAWWQERADGPLGEEILRKDPGLGNQQIELQMEVEELDETYDYSLQLEERRYSDREIASLFEQAKKEIDEQLYQEGDTAECAREKLNLLTEAADGQIEIQWEFDPPGVLDWEGNILEDMIEQEGTLIHMSACLFYEEEQELYDFYVRVYPPIRSEKESILRDMDSYVKKQSDEMGEQSEFRLPEQLEGYHITWKKKPEQSVWVVLLLGMTAMLLLPWYQKEQEVKKQREKQRELEYAYPMMVEEFLLLLGSGMTTKNVWNHIVSNYEKQKDVGKKKKNELYEQMAITNCQMQEGISELSAYERFSNRCNNPRCRRFILLLTQYVQKGTRGMSLALEEEARIALEERKANVRKKGEEAGTKLVFPMLLMLFVVIVIMMVPAGLSMNV